MSNFKWVAIHTANGLRENEDGILGLGESYSESGILYVPELYNAGVITEPTFSILLTSDWGTTGTSYIDFGTPDTSVMSDTNDLVYIDSIQHENWWTANVDAWRWKDGTTH